MAKIPFGLATITLDEGGTAPLVFDGVANMQAEGGEVSLKPIFEDVNIADYGKSVYDKILVGYEGEVKVVASDGRDLNLLAQALGGADKLTDVSQKVTHVFDGKIGTSMRSKSKKLRIHPRDMGSDQSLDIVIYNAVSTSDLTQGYENQQGKLEITLTMFVKTGADPTKANNFFYIGASQPTLP